MKERRSEVWFQQADPSRLSMPWRQESMPFVAFSGFFLRVACGRGFSCCVADIRHERNPGLGFLCWRRRARRSEVWDGPPRSPLSQEMTDLISGARSKKARFRAKAFAIIILLSTCSIADAGSTIIGAGSQTCTAWTNRKKNKVVKGSFESWLVGFISGLNLSGERDMIGGGDFDAITEWMDRHCLATPSERIGILALDLGMELARKAVKP
jgi:hypothetical protein